MVNQLDTKTPSFAKEENRSLSRIYHHKGTKRNRNAMCSLEMGEIKGTVYA